MGLFKLLFIIQADGRGGEGGGGRIGHFTIIAQIFLKFRRVDAEFVPAPLFHRSEKFKKKKKP